MSGGNFKLGSNRRGSGQPSPRRMGAFSAIGLGVSCLVFASPAEAQFRKIGEMELRLSGLSATVENSEPVVPKNTPGGIRVLVRAGGVDLSIADLSRFLGHDFSVQGELSGPGLSQPVALPVLRPGEELPADPLILPTPPIVIAGNYRLSNLRIVAGGRTVLDVDPSSVPLKVIDQILVTQVTTRALTLDEIRGKGIVLDSDDYLGFEFTMGFKLDSKAVDLKFPVVFDRQGVAVPQPLSPPAAPSREGVSLPTILPLLLQAEDANGDPVEIPKVTMPSGVVKPVTIPAVLVIPGNVGYLKQFFSAQLYVSNGAPVGSKLNVRDIRATLKLPPGADLQLGTTDDPLALPELERDGRVMTQPLSADVLGIGADGVAGTSDDIAELAPAEQGQAEFLIRGEREGFHQINFDLSAQLLGLPIGPVTVKGKAAGGVLVRNPYFNVTFAVPSVVRSGERFKMRATVTNIGKGIGNDVSMTLDASRMSGLTLQGEGTQRIATLRSGDARSLEFEFVAQRTGKVVATYLKFDTQSGNTGQLNFTIGVGERNVPLSPDTLVLPASTDNLPADVVDAAMRVLGQAWSVANAPSGTLPQGVIRVSGQVVVKKALALAEAGLRVTLGQSNEAAVRDLLYDFFSGAPVDPGFDQLLRTTEAGHDFVRAAGGALSDAAMQAGGGPGYEFDTARLVASAAPFISFGWDGVKGDLALVDGAGRTSIRSTNLAAPAALASHNVVGGVLVPLGSDAMLGLATQPSAGPYRWEFRAAEAGTGSLSVTFPRPDGSFGRAVWSGAVSLGSIVRVMTDDSGQATAQVDLNGDGVFDSTDSLSVNTLAADGPRLLAAAIIGPETLDGAGPWGFQTALVFDRVVGESSAALATNYAVPNNQLRSARRQLSGRLVFAALSLPEGPYIPNRIMARGIEDTRGVVGAEITMPLVSRLGGSGPGSSAEMGAIVSGRVLDSDGTPLPGRTVTYAQFPSLICSDVMSPLGFAAPVTDSSGAFELRYVRQDLCGNPFQLFTIDPSTGARRSQSLYVRSAGQQIVADFVMLAAGSVNGTVKDFRNQPVAGAKVAVLSQTETQVGAATVTDALGRYSVSGITVGPVVVRVAKGSGVGSAAGRIDRPNVPAVVDVTIADGSVQAHGIVRTVDGGVTKAAIGAVVTYAINPAAPQTMGATTTDGLGRYAFSGMPVGPFVIRAQANTRDFAMVTGVAAAGDDVQRDISVEIPPVTSLGYIEGQVVMPDGSPADGVIVSSGAGSVLSGANGLFVLPVVPQISAHLVSATTRDRKRTGQTAVSVISGGDRATGVRIVLSSLGTAEFTVLDMTGQPLVGRTVKLLDSKVDPCGRTAALSDAQGRARFTSLGVGAALAQVINEGEIVDAARASVSVSGEGSTGFGVLRVETRASTIGGTVVDASGNPVMGADIELRSLAFVQDPAAMICDMQPTVTHRARTDVNGRFRFTGVHPGRVYVTANQPDFAPTPVMAVQDVGGGASVDLTLRLVSTTAGKITGVVYEPDGTTSAGPGVEVTMTGLLPDVTVVTNAGGAFSFPEVFPQGGYTITARDPITGLVEQERLYAAAGVPLRHDIRLKGKAAVRVRVETADAQPVTNAYVTLREAAYPGRVFEGVLDASSQGRVDFPGVFEGQVSIEVRDPLGRTGGRNALTIPSGSTLVETMVRVTTTGTVRGRFLRPAGDDSAIPYGSVRLLVGGRLIGQVTTTATEPAGSYEFSYVPAGAFRLEGLDPLTGRTGFATGAIENEGDLVQVDMRAQAIGAVTGMVTENGTARGGARVELTSGGYSATTMSDSGGRYLVQGVPEGRVVVSADLGNTGGGAFLRGTASGNLLGEGSTLDLNVALRDSGRVTGQVLKAGAGSDPAGVVAISIYVGGVGGGVVTGSTDENGHFEFTRVPAGLATLTVEALGSDDFASGAVDVPAGGDAAPVTLRLNGIGSLHGVGRDSFGAPVQGWLNIAYGPAERRRGAAIALGADGAFTLPHVLAGPFTANLRVTSGAVALYGTASGTIAEGQTTEVVVRLQDSATVVGRVLRADGITPAYGAVVTLNLSGTPSSSTVQAQADGRFTFRGASLGAFNVKVSDPVTAGLAQASGTTSTNGEVSDLGDLVLDDSPVQVLSVDPADGATGVSVTKPITLTFSDPLLSTGGFGILDGTAGVVVPPPILSNGARTITFNPPGGGWPNPKTLTVLASTSVTDLLGRRLTQAFTSHFTTEDKAPPLAISYSPASGAIQIPSDSAIEVTFSEPLALSAASLEGVIRVFRAGVGQIPGASTQTAPDRVRFQPASLLPENSSYSVVVNGAVDLLGNVQTSQQVFTFSSTDTLPPVLTLSAPSPSSSVRNQRPTIAVSALDALTGFDATAPVVLTVDGQAVTTVKTVNGFHHLPLADLAEGTHQVFAQAQDRAGNLATLSAAFIVDVSPPSSVSLLAPAANQTISGTFTFSGAAVDALSPIQRIEVMEGSQVKTTLFSPAFAVPFDSRSLGEGFHTFLPRAYDAAGNSSEGPPITVLVDNTPLVVTIIQPAPGARFQSSVTVTAAVSEPVQRVEFTAPGFAPVSVAAPGPYTATLDLSGVPESESFTIVATATASQGGTGSTSVTIAIDRTPPGVVVAAKVLAASRAGSPVQVVGSSGAAEGKATVEITNPRTGDVRLAPAALDGSFVSSMPGVTGDVLRLAQIDAAGNRGGFVEVVVTTAAALEGVPTRGLRMWVSADAIPPVPADPSGWSGVWPDASSAPNNLLQTTPSARPLLVASAPAFGGLPVLRFDGSTDFLRFTSPVTPIQTVFWVLQDTSGDSSARFLLSNFAGTPWDFAPGATGEAIWSTLASPAVIGGQTWVNGVPVKGTVSGRPRQVSIVSVVTAGATRADTFGTHMGLSQFFKGDLAEMLIYDQPLDADERRSVEDYLARKYRPYTPRVSAPVVSPSGAVFDGSTTVQISTATPDAAIHFTLDGSTPTRLSPEYSGPFVVDQTTTVKAAAFRESFEDSAVSTAGFIRSDGGPIRDAHLRMWVRADAEMGTSSGSYLPMWRDLSSASNHLVQPNGAALPLHVPEASNGLPALRFDGSSDYFKFTTPMTDIRTVFFVARESSSATGSYRYLLGDTVSSYPFASGASTLWEPNNTAAAVREGDTYINGAPVDGTQTARPKDLSVISVVTTADVPARLFGSYNGDIQFWWGDVSEVLIYNRALAPAERRAVEAYLGARYAIAAAAPSFGTVQVDVKRAGVSQSGVAVTLLSDSIAVAPADNTKTAATNASGRATASMPVGFLTARVTDGGVAYEATGTLRVGGGLTLVINLPALPTVLRGRVVASDGLTPLPGVTVSVGAKQSVTDLNGDYRIDSPVTGSPTVAFSFQGLSDTVTAAIPSGSETILNHTHTRAPLHVVSVTENLTGAPIPGVGIAVCSSFQPTHCAPARTTDSLGRVQYVGQPTGSAADAGWHNVTAITADGASLTRSAFFYYDSPGRADIVFEPPGRVHGTIRLPGGLPASGVDLWVDDLTGFSSTTQIAATDGTYSFPRLGGHTVTVGATSSDGLAEATASASVPVGGDVTVDLTLPAALVEITLVDGAGLPLAGQPIDVTVVGPRTLNRTTDADGRVSVTLRAGFTQVIASSPELAAAEFDLAAGDAREVTLNAGSHHPPSAIGDYNVSGSSDGPVTPAQFELYGASPRYVFRSNQSAAGRSEARVASYDSSWSSPTAVYYHQTLFVPTGGAFARSLTTFTNPSDTEVTVNALAPLGAYGSVDATEDSLTVDGAYSVAFGSGGDYFCGEGCFIRHTLVLPPHTTKGLLAFTTMDPTLIPSLRDLSAMGALADLSQAERDSIVNFGLPVPIAAVVEGVAQSSTGSALSGATVAVGRGDTVMAQGVTGADGAFSLAVAGPAGAYRVVFVSGDHVFQAVVAILADGALSLGPLQALDPLARGSARLLVEDGTGAPVENLAVSARSSGLFGLDPVISAVVDAGGQVVLSGLIPGLNRIETPLGAAYVRVTSGGEDTLRIRRGAFSQAASGAITLNGSPVAGAVVVATEWDSQTSAEIVVARSSTGADGQYLLSGLRENSTAYIYAWDPELLRNASGSVDVGTGPAAAAATIALATDDSVGSVLIRGVLESNGTRAAEHVATLQLAYWPFSLDLTLDAQGEARVSGLPGGNYAVVTVSGSGGFGREMALTMSAVETLLTVPVGTRAALPADREPFRLTSFALEDGNTPRSFQLRTNVEMGNALEPFSELASGAVSPDGTTFTLVYRTSPQYAGETALRLERKVFIPAGSAFARVFDTVENVSDAPTQANYNVFPSFGLAQGTVSEILGDGAIDQGDAAFVLQTDQPSGEVAGFVVRQPVAAVPDSFGQTDYGASREAFFSWQNVALGPGEKRSFMSFVVFARGPGAAASVVSRIQSLLALADPLALAGLSSEERSRLVNWVTP